MSRREIALRRVRERPQGRHTDQSRTEVFKWAWDSLEDWGPLDDKGEQIRIWNQSERIEQAQAFAWLAVNAPVWTPEPRKRWPAAEDA